MSHEINIVIPMAGAGSRFAKAGYELPKPFINVKGKMMIERVLDNLKYEGAKYILIAKKEHTDTYPQFFDRLKSTYDITITTVDNLTDGAACTILSAHRYINNDRPMMIANSDQIVDINIGDFIDDCFERKLDGSILTFNNEDIKWSYAKTDKDGLVEEVAEKNPISDHATVGIYLYSKGKYLIDGTMDMIAQADKTNHEYYVCPAYNYIIQSGKKIGIYEIKESDMHGTGTPKDLERYIELI